MSKELNSQSANEDDLKHINAVKQEPFSSVSISLKELFAEQDRYKVYPKFQRSEVWTLRQKQSLIDTILFGDPIPPLEGYQELNEEGKTVWRLNNGHQRVSAILSFMRGDFKTWTRGQKRIAEPNSTFAPIEPGNFFDDLPEGAKNFCLDYRIRIDNIRPRPEQELVTRFLRIQNQVPLSKAEKLNAFASKAKDAAQLIEQHSFWEDFFQGKQRKRKEIFQSSLHLLAIEMTPGGIRDVQSGGWIYGLAYGKYDNAINDDLIDAVLRRLEIVTHLYADTQFTIRAASIAMYQSVIFLEQSGYTVQKKDKGRLTNWITALIAESNRASTLPSYRRSVQQLTGAKAQREFWEKHMKTILALFSVPEHIRREYDKITAL